MKKSKTKLLFSFISLIILISTIVRINTSVVSKYKNENEFIGIVTNYKQSTCMQIELLAKEKILVFDCNNNHYEYGEKLKINGKLKTPKNSTTFNYRNYLLSKKINYIVYPEKIQKLKKTNNYIYVLKNKMNEKINHYKSKNYLKAFIFGSTELIDEEIIQSYRLNGISHLFAISGMHITLLSTILFIILNKIFKRKTSFILISIFFMF